MVQLCDNHSCIKSTLVLLSANYLKFFPISYYFEPEEKVPIGFSEVLFDDVLPPELLSHYKNNVNVRSLKIAKEGLIVEDKLKIGRSIEVRFKNDGDSGSHIYQLFDQEITNFNEKTHSAKVTMTLPDTQPSADEFKVWVYQSINRAAQSHYDKLTKELFLSSRFAASYLTNSPFSHHLLGEKLGGDKGIKESTIDCVIKMHLPFLSNISIADLMSLRANDGEAFDSFRRELERQFRELRLENDPVTIQAKLENAIHELSEIQVSKIETKIKHLRKGALAQTGVVIGGLIGCVATSNLSVIASIIALFKGIKLYSEYQEEIKSNPAYFLWKVKKS